MAASSSESEHVLHEYNDSDLDHRAQIHDGAEARTQKDTSRKRPRVVASQRCGPVGSLPRDLSDAMIMLRVAKEKKFLAAADGRSRHGSARIWEEISVELTDSCQDRDDVAASALSARALGKRWSYVEKMFKVCALYWNMLLYAVTLSCA